MSARPRSGVTISGYRLNLLLLITALLTSLTGIIAGERSGVRVEASASVEAEPLAAPALEMVGVDRQAVTSVASRLTTPRGVDRALFLPLAGRLTPDKRIE